LVERYKPIRFSRAGIRGLKASATIAINDRVREMWAAGQDVYHLAFGESRFPIHPKIAEALADNVHKRSYLPALGIPELRRTIAKHYQTRFGLDVAPDQVAIGPGSKSLIFAAMLALGEEIIIPQPSWVSYGPQAHLLGKPITFIPTRPDTNFEFELDVLEARIEESRRSWGNPEVFMVNSPKNPTGTMMRPEKVEALALFAREHELMVLSDEIYALTAFTRIPHISIARYYPEGTVVFGGLSKSLPLGGWRFGTAIIPRENGGKALLQAIQNIASNIWTCVTAPVQYAALAAYSGDPEVEEYIDICARMHAIRTRFLYDTMVKLGVSCVEPAGATRASASGATSLPRWGFTTTRSWRSTCSSTTRSPRSPARTSTPRRSSASGSPRATSTRPPTRRPMPSSPGTGRTPTRNGSSRTITPACSAWRSGSATSSRTSTAADP